MEITRELVDHISQLARLELAADERENLRSQLQRILGAVEKLDACKPDPADTSDGLPDGVLREDVVASCLSREAALANAPASTPRGFAVPRVLDGAETP